MKSYLSDRRIVDLAQCEKIADEVRDKKGVTVWRCRTSGVIFLEGALVETDPYYAQKNVEGDLNTSITEVDGTLCAAQGLEDDARRAAQFNNQIRGKTWLDFGAGEGELVRMMAPKAKLAHAFELNAAQTARMRAKGIPALDNWRALEAGSLDVLTLFHVFEHLPQPVELMQELATKVRPGGAVIVEVPHANDFLIKSLDCDAFKHFSFWSEHLVLHTRASLEALLRLAGFMDVIVTGFQRYPLPNHLYWLRHGRPGGHDIWGAMDTDDMRKAYAAWLSGIDQTDTLIATCHKPPG